MTDDDKSPDVPEFVAVTPRGAVPDRQETPAEPEPPVAADEAASDPDREAAEVDEAAESGPAEQPAAETEPPAEPENGSEPDSAAQPESTPAEAGVADPGNDESTAERGPGVESAAPALKWTAPALERPVSLTKGDAPEPDADPAADPDAEPDAESATATTAVDPTPVGDVEVSVRVAAEGMAAALAGHAAPEPDEADAATRSVGPLAIVTAVCVVLALAAAALLAVTAHTNSNHRAVNAARAAALEAAKRETAVALTYDYRTLDADFQRAEAGMSRKFRANYAQTAASSVAPLARKTHAITTGSVAAGGVVSATPSTARILVFANQTVENKLLNATSRLDRSVIEVTMVKENGRWVIDNLQPF